MKKQMEIPNGGTSPKIARLEGCRVPTNMFGAICAGRPVQTDIQQVDQNKYVFTISDAAKINHMVVFLLPGATIDPALAASVYFQLPGKDFKLLGSISQSKPSAIFKINSNTSSSTAHGDIDEMMMQDDAGAGPTDSFDINVGISIEPAAVVEQNLLEQRRQSISTPLLPPPIVPPSAAPTNAADIAVLANKIVQHAYNFLGSFVTPQGMVPMKAFDEWWAKFKTKLQTNPRFLDNLD